jgi:hypothetical protein
VDRITSGVASAAFDRTFRWKGVDMGLNGIESSALRVLDAGRAPGVSEASGNETVTRQPPEIVQVKQDPEPRGVPQTLAVHRQMPPNTRLHVDEESKQIVAQILDENNEVIRQIPAEALLELSSKFNRLEGLLFNREG